MAIIFEEALKKSLARGEMHRVYLLFGEDAYLKTLYLNKISLGIADNDDVFNYCKFTGLCDLQSVYDAVLQLPFMSDRKCIILNDYDFEHCAKFELDRLLELISEVPQEVTLIMYFDSVEFDHKKSAKFKQLVTAAEKVGGVAVLLNHRSRSELAKMLSDGALKRHCQMDRSVAEYLVDTAGEDINLLTNELTKLCAYVGECAVTKAHIDEVCTKTVEANIYRLSDYILTGNSTEALKILDELFFLKTEPMAILYTISAVFVDLYRVYAAIQQGLKFSQVGEAFSYKNKEFLLEKAARNLRKLEFKHISLALNTLTEADCKLKSTGSNPKTVLEETVVKLIYIVAKGEALD